MVLRRIIISFFFINSLFSFSQEKQFFRNYSEEKICIPETYFEKSTNIVYTGKLLNITYLLSKFEGQEVIDKNLISFFCTQDVINGYTSVWSEFKKSRRSHIRTCKSCDSMQKKRFLILPQYLISTHFNSHLLLIEIKDTSNIAENVVSKDLFLINELEGELRSIVKVASYFTYGGVVSYTVKQQKITYIREDFESIDAEDDFYGNSDELGSYYIDNEGYVELFK